jgi:NADH-quinone oxidoreductase subunit M
MIDNAILSLLLIVPLVGAAFIAFFAQGEGEHVVRNARNTALMTTTVNFILSLLLFVQFEAGAADYQFVEKYEWFSGIGISYYLGVDGISLYLIMLTTFLMPLCILAGWESIKHRIRDYMVAFLVLESLVIGTFCALDALLFYVFFEAVLIPMYIIIGIWGGSNRVYAAFKFFLYTLLIISVFPVWDDGNPDISPKGE